MSRITDPRKLFDGLCNIAIEILDYRGPLLTNTEES